MAGSSSQHVIVGPIAVRSIRTLREAASDLREIVLTAVPEVCDRLGTVKCRGQLKRLRFRGMQQLKSGRRAIEGSSVHKG
jgi:hypothetical protein